VIAETREEVRRSAALEEGERRDLIALFDSIEKVQSRAARRAMRRSPPMQGGFSIPFAMRQEEVTSGRDRRYNGFAHAFAGMGVQFVLFMGIELGVAVLYMRKLGIWKRLRAAPLTRNQLVASRILSGTLIAFLLMLGIYVAAIAVFGVRIEGSLVGFLGVMLAFALLASTFGLLIAALRPDAGSQRAASPSSRRCCS
jgi:ABC-2 type transport system permease protein